MIKSSDIPLGSPIYSFVHERTGQNVDISVSALIDYVNKAKPEIFRVPVDFGYVKLLKENKSIREDLLLKAAISINRNTVKPVIYCMNEGHCPAPPDAFLADGAHRYVACWVLKRQFVYSYVLPRIVWEPFLISDLPKITREQLRNNPR